MQSEGAGDRTAKLVVKGTTRSTPHGVQGVSLEKVETDLQQKKKKKLLFPNRILQQDKRLILYGDLKNTKTIQAGPDVTDTAPLGD